MAKILVVTNGYPNRYKPYAGMYLKRQVQLLRDSGLEVTVLTPADSRQGIFRSSWKYIRLFFRVVGALLWADFDLVHAHWELPSGLFGLIVSRLRHKPFVLTAHGTFTNDFEKCPWLIRHMVRRVLRSADHIITVGQAQKRRVQAIAGLPEIRITVINMGVWLAEVPISRAEARKILGLKQEQKLILFIGNLLFIKGPDVLIDSTVLLRQNGITAQVIIGGEGGERPKLIELVRRLALSDSVALIGGVSHLEVPTWFTAADVCVVPSRNEAFGLVAIEAMACGTPVVAADVGGLRETITHGENGFLFPVGDPVALAEQLRLLLSDDALRGSVVEAGRRTAAAHDMRLKSAQVKGIYESLLKGSQG